ncbi:hypothetical protein HKX48_008280, partial [Thoreauomyces humboldtii]
AQELAHARAQAPTQMGLQARTHLPGGTSSSVVKKAVKTKVRRNTKRNVSPAVAQQSLAMLPPGDVLGRIGRYAEIFNPSGSDQWFYPVQERSTERYT